MTLIGIRFSHYVEKVRWALDRFEIPYTEKPLLPILHFATAARYLGLRGAPDQHSSRWSTPLLIDERGEIHQKSSAILRYLDDRFGGERGGLFAHPEAEARDAHYNDHLGPDVRRIFYHEVFAQPDVIREIAVRNVGGSRAALFNGMLPMVRTMMKRAFRISPAEVEKSLGIVYREFEAVEKTLSDGRPYLLGDRFGIADISFACLGGAILLPSPAEGYGGFLPPLDSPCAGLTRLARELRATGAGRWVLKQFREEHGRRAIPAVPPLLAGNA